MCLGVWWYVSIGSGYGLSPNRRQAITWSNVDRPRSITTLGYTKPQWVNPTSSPIKMTTNRYIDFVGITCQYIAFTCSMHPRKNVQWQLLVYQANIFNTSCPFIFVTSSVLTVRNVLIKWAKSVFIWPLFQYLVEAEWRIYISLV